MAADPLDQVLRLVAEGRLTAEEAAPILAALDERPPAGGGAGPASQGASGRAAQGGDPAGDAAPGGPGSQAATSIRIEVREGGRQVVNVRLPIAIGRLALDRVPGLSGDQVDRVRQALASGMHGPIVAVDDGDNTVRIVLE